MRSKTYPIAPRGRATSFTESELRPEYALQFRNRFINAAGGAEKRQGLERLGAVVPGTPTLDGVHELVGKDGTETLFVSGEGSIYKHDSVLEIYSQVHSGLNVNAPLQSVSMGDKLIFFNGVDRTVFTTDGITFAELRAIIERGAATAGTDIDTLKNSDIDNWVTDTQVAINDIVRNVTRGGFGIVTAVATASVAHTVIAATALADGIGIVAASSQSGDRYEIIDSVELNIIPTDDVLGPDNVAILNSDSSAAGIFVSGVPDWTKTDIRVGDYIHNTTQEALTRVTAIATASIGVVGVSAQTAGDSVTFHKSAIPIAQRGHVHFGRLYTIDSRDLRLLRISGANNPEDMTTDAGTLDSSTFRFGEIQPDGDALVTMGSFQRFFVMAGKKNLYLFSGVDPIADVSANPVGNQSTSPAFDIIGLFPQGVVAENGAVSIGNDFIFLTPDGVQSTALVNDSSTLGRSNLSESIKVTLRDDVAKTGEDDIFAFHYPKRSWFCLKVGGELHIFNYTAQFGKDPLTGGDFGGVGLSTQGGAWHLFDGKLARQKAFKVRRNGDLVCCGNGGNVYIFDQGNYDDDGENFSTEYQTGWLTLEEPRRGVRTRQGHYIKPIIEASDNIEYTIRAEGDFAGRSSEIVVVNASGGSVIGLAEIGKDIIGGSKTSNRKYPLRWRGEQVRFTFTTEDAKGPDILSRYEVYETQWGKN